MTREEFIAKAVGKHGNKFNYSMVNYVNSHTNVDIICPKHGRFSQQPGVHLGSKHGCPKCAFEASSKIQQLTLDEFLEKARAIHGDRFDYSKVKYNGYHEKVCITCRLHGDFYQTPINHLKGKGCPVCYGNKKLTQDEFIERAIAIHGDKYDYSLCQYQNVDKKVTIICPVHGQFEQSPYHHINRKCGCPKCGGRMKRTTEEFVEKAKSIHGDRYDYSNVGYVNNVTPVEITCNVHGGFMMKPTDHINKHEGCPSCKSSRYENRVAEVLRTNGILFIQEKRFDWLVSENQMRIDFYIPRFNLAIEVQGEQHFKPINFGSSSRDANTMFVGVKMRDALKRSLCEEHGVMLRYVNYYDDIPQKIAEILEEAKMIKQK